MAGTLTFIATPETKPGQEDRLPSELDAMVVPSLAERDVWRTGRT